MKAWSSDIPKPWNSLSDISKVKTESDKGRTTPSEEDPPSPTSSPNERQIDEDTPTLGCILNSEPHIWSRLKIIYSFEYKPSWLTGMTRRLLYGELPYIPYVHFHWLTWCVAWSNCVASRESSQRSEKARSSSQSARFWRKKWVWRQSSVRIIATMENITAWLLPTHYRTFYRFWKNVSWNGTWKK